MNPEVLQIGKPRETASPGAKQSAGQKRDWRYVSRELGWAALKGGVQGGSREYRRQRPEIDETVSRDMPWYKRELEISRQMNKKQIAKEAAKSATESAIRRGIEIGIGKNATSRMNTQNFAAAA